MSAEISAKKIALLRSNPKDAAFERVAALLSPEHSVVCYLWDRQLDYRPPSVDSGIIYRKFRLRAGYHSLGVLIKLLLFETWLFVQLVLDGSHAIHAFDLDTGVTAWIAARLRGKKFVYHCLDPYAGALPRSWPRMFGRMASALENFIISRSDLFIITDIMRMEQHHGAHPRVTVEFANVPPELTVKETSRNRQQFIAGYIGSLVEGRNLNTIIEAVGEIGKDIELIIGGFGPLEENVNSLCSRYKNVKFIGFVPYRKLLELEQGFDVLIHITDPENPGQKWVSPNKLFESMALAKPLLAGLGTIAGARVTSAGNGITVPYGSKKDVQKSLLMLKENPDMAHEMGRRGRQEYDRKWKPEIMRERLLRAYHTLLA